MAEFRLLKPLMAGPDRQAFVCRLKRPKVSERGLRGIRFIDRLGWPFRIAPVDLARLLGFGSFEEF